MAITIEPARIPEEGEDFEGEEPAEALDLAPDDEAVAAGPVAYHLHVQLAGLDLIVTGQVAAKVQFTCSRCAAEFKADVGDEAFFFEKRLHDLHSPVDLTEEVRESIILAFPSYPVCRPACRGLCPRCGANRNRKRCGCPEQPESMGSVFDVLDVKERTDHGSTQKEEIEE